MDEQAKTPTTPTSDEAPVTPETPSEQPPAEPPVQSAPPAAVPTPPAPSVDSDNGGDLSMDQRLERLGGEPAPVITPEEFARLQRQGQVHIDERGRVKTTRRSGAEAGVSLRKRRAWFDGYSKLRTYAVDQ